MKKILKNVFVSTAVTILLLAGIAAVFYGAGWLSIATIYQLFLVNTLLHIALYIIHALEIRYRAVENILELLSIMIIVLLSGAIFGWYVQVPVWLVALMVVFIYLAMKIMDSIYARKDSEELNKLLCFVRRLFVMDLLLFV